MTGDAPLIERRATTARSRQTFVGDRGLFEARAPRWSRVRHGPFRRIVVETCQAWSLAHQPPSSLELTAPIVRQTMLVHSSAKSSTAKSLAAIARVTTDHHRRTINGTRGDTQRAMRGLALGAIYPRFVTEGYFYGSTLSFHTF